MKRSVLTSLALVLALPAFAQEPAIEPEPEAASESVERQLVERLAQSVEELKKNASANEDRSKAWS